MRRARFGDRPVVPNDPRLTGVSVQPLTANIASGAGVQAAIFRIEAGGGIARHAAGVSQLLAVLDGSGEVSGDDGTFEPIAEGEAVFWSVGEEHETRSDHGMTALIIEGEGVRPPSPKPG